MGTLFDLEGKGHIQSSCCISEQKNLRPYLLNDHLLLPFSPRPHTIFLIDPL